MPHPALRFFQASLISAVSAVVVATLTTPIATAFGSDAIDASSEGGILRGIATSLAVLPFAIAIGGMITLPTALVMGGIMVWLTARRPALDRAWVWAVAAVVGSIPAMLFIGGAYAFFPDRALLCIWMALSGIVGALVFRWFWRRDTAQKL